MGCLWLSLWLCCLQWSSTATVIHSCWIKGAFCLQYFCVSLWFNTLLVVAEEDNMQNIFYFLVDVEERNVSVLRFIILVILVLYELLMIYGIFNIFIYLLLLLLIVFIYTCNVNGSLSSLYACVSLLIVYNSTFWFVVGTWSWKRANTKVAKNVEGLG